MGSHREGNRGRRRNPLKSGSCKILTREIRARAVIAEMECSLIAEEADKSEQ